ncbi:MAG: hypothetical protein ACJ74Q_15310 [Pyrinomonadaceae bacterium]
MRAISQTPFTAAGRNAVWVYPREVPPRFAGAPAIIETARAHEMPDIEGLPEGADVSVELYRGAITFKLDGQNFRVYLARFDYVAFAHARAARYAFGLLWEAVEHLNSADEVRAAAEKWRGEMKEQREFSERRVRGEAR